MATKAAAPTSTVATSTEKKISNFNAKKTVQLPKFGALPTTEPSKEKEQTKAKEVQVQKVTEEENFSEDAFRKSWKIFTEQLKKDGHQHAAIALDSDFILEGTSVTVHLVNPLQEEFILKVKHKLLGHLRQSMRNKNIDVHTVFNEVINKPKAYTEKDKLNLLIEKYPVLKDFKERLGLDPDL